MAQPVIIPGFINREYLIKNFNRMIGERQESNGRKYTHFVPKQPSGFTTQVTNEDEYPIYECNCRSEMGRTWRKDIVQDSLLEKVGQTYDKKKPLVIYCVGSGGGYDEFSNCIGLAAKAYEVKKIILVDQGYDLQKENDLENDPRVKEFTAYSKVLFPNIQISPFHREDEYFKAIKAQKQPKPDIILCFDVEEAHNFTFRQKDYKEMLGSSSNQLIFAYHNPVDSSDAGKGVKTSIEVIQGENKQ